MDLSTLIERTRNRIGDHGEPRGGPASPLLTKADFGVCVACAWTKQVLGSGHRIAGGSDEVLQDIIGVGVSSPR